MGDPSANNDGHIWKGFDYGQSCEGEMYKILHERLQKSWHTYCFLPQILSTSLHSTTYAFIWSQPLQCSMHSWTLSWLQEWYACLLQGIFSFLVTKRGNILLNMHQYIRVAISARSGGGGGELILVPLDTSFGLIILTKKVLPLSISSFLNWGKHWWNF